MLAADTALDPFQTIAELSGDVAFIVALPDAAVHYMGAGCAALTGYSSAQWCDPMSDAAPVLAGLMAGWQLRLARLVDGNGKGDSGGGANKLVREVEISHRLGHKVPLEIISTFTFDAAGNPAALVGIVRDVAQRREHEAGRRRFASMLNHEFRTPLSTIDGAIQRLQVTGQAADQATLDRYRKIANAVDQMIGMLEQYLSPDVVAASGTVARSDRVNPRRLLEEGAQWVRASGRTVTLELGKLPDSLRGEPQGLRLVLRVLIDNALQYGPADQPIALLGSVRADTIVLAVHDSGAGVPAGEEQQVFGKHVRGSNAGHLAGAGLGLYMARSVVEVHGGVIEYQRQVANDGGARTAFRICLPVRTVTGKEVATAGPSSDNSGNKH